MADESDTPLDSGCVDGPLKVTGGVKYPAEFAAASIPKGNQSIAPAKCKISQR
jgi:hypothetical protein